MIRKSLRIQKLARKEEKTTIKRIFLLSLISGILILFLFTMGVSLLGKFADFLEFIFGKKDELQAVDKIKPVAPQLESLPVATNSSRIDVSGFSANGTVVEIYINQTKIKEVKVNNGKFSFDNLPLKNGENTVTAKAKSASGKSSDFSPTSVITLDIEKPSLEVTEPAAGQSFSGNNRIKVAGTTDKDAQVYVNGFLASIYQGKSFEVFVPVVEGENNLEIKAIDEAGNVTLESRKIHYSK